MITDARVLQPEFIPQEVKHRDAEINYLSSVLRPILNGQPTDPAFLYGPSGAGKTCIAQFTVERLRETVVELNHQYVNCWEDYNRFKALYRLLAGINQTLDVHRRSTPKDLLLERLRDYDGPPYIVILDEVDQLEDKALLYDLYRIPNLTMLLIANNEEELFASLDERLNSRLTACTRIHFRQYSNEELISILRDRVQWGINDNAIDEPCLRLIAENAVGDARIAIGILRKAARRAHEDQYNKITQDTIRKVVPEAKTEIKQKTVDRLNSHQETLYEIITEYGEIQPSTLYEEYQERVTEPKTRRMVRNYLSKLEHYNLITAKGSTKSRTYRSPSQSPSLS